MRHETRRYHWGREVLIAADQLLNALLRGWADETISSRAAKARLEGKTWGCVLCRILDVFDQDHCRKSIEFDEGYPVEPTV
jgi:hypothetical protein